MALPSLTPSGNFARLTLLLCASAHASTGATRDLSTVVPSQGVAVSRPKHPDKDLERLLKDAESQGWRVVKRKRAKYYKILCPCPEQHFKLSIHMTPSDPQYERNLRYWLLKNTCWEQGEE